MFESRVDWGVIEKALMEKGAAMKLCDPFWIGPLVRWMQLSYGYGEEANGYVHGVA